MTLKQWLLNAVGANKDSPLPPAQKVPTEEENNAMRERDAQLAQASWKRFGLQFRSDGYRPADWMKPVVADHGQPPSGSLIHLNVHPLACYRALGLSNVVDHWVPWVADTGWDVLTQNLPYALKRLGPAKQWGHIEHPAFWKEVAAMLATKDTTGVETQGLLAHAGWAGNLVPFEALPFKDVEQYSNSGQTCHPRVALWLNKAGLRPQELLLPSLGDWNDLFPWAGNTFLHWSKSAPIPIAYVLDWIEPILADFPLTQEHKVSLVGQAIIAFGSEAWDKHFAPTCAPHLAEIDMALLRSVCGLRTPEAGSLAETLSTWTQGIKPLLHEDSESTGQESQQLKNPHAGLSMLINLQEPTSRAQLYSLAVMAQKIDKGLIAAPETVALPSMD